MRSEQDIKQLKEELLKLNDFIADLGTDEEFKNKDIGFACAVGDALDWVLEEISTEHFRGGAYLDLERLYHIAKAIQKRTGKKFADHE